MSKNLRFKALEKKKGSDFKSYVPHWAPCPLLWLWVLVPLPPLFLSLLEAGLIFPLFLSFYYYVCFSIGTVYEERQVCEVFQVEGTRRGLPSPHTRVAKLVMVAGEFQLKMVAFEDGPPQSCLSSPNPALLRVNPQISKNFLVQR